ncbi:MAG TPA: hypothetical protein EYP08_03945, partial [Pyrodictiaceae archaeon]|nr:hypothetical protein [Pyrodictiaceae archaeon]
MTQAHDKARQLRLGFLLHGVGPGWDDWRHPDAQVDASTSFSFKPSSVLLGSTVIWIASTRLTRFVSEEGFTGFETSL